jgi:hypothetical protein
MPNVGGKKFPYTKQGMKDAEEAKDKMGYKEGGAMKGRDKDGNKVSYSFNEAERKKDAKKKKAKKKPMKMMADDGGSITGKMNPNRKKVLEKMEANNSKPTPSMKGAMNNTSAPKPPTPPQAAMGAAPAMGAAAGGMGMPPKKPPMPGMKAGGKVKKKAKSYGHGGKVRGAGIAKKGVRKCKMR